MIGHRWLRLAVAFGLQTIHRNGTKEKVMSAEDKVETRLAADGGELLTIDHVDGESDIAFAERWSSVIEESGHDWGHDIETALFVAVREVRRLRELVTAAEVRVVQQRALKEMAVSDLSQVDDVIAEVRRLRDEVARLRAVEETIDHHLADQVIQLNEQNGQLEAKLAHISTFPDKWDAEQRTSDVGLDGFDCAHELRTALATK